MEVSLNFWEFILYAIIFAVVGVGLAELFKRN